LTTSFRVPPPESTNDYNNLVYACTACNSAKQNRAVLDPFSDAYANHVEVQHDRVIRGLSTDGSNHLRILCLDSVELTEFRNRFIDLLRLISGSGDADALRLMRGWFGYPDDLPNLAAKRPPGGNTLPEAAEHCYFEQRRIGKLSDYC
jgi:hypothetical protein